ncbi:hypothetical protein QTH97_33295 [Variovorax sp. J22R24]|uniref:hypothetical protein n=1 Tax=Variovorax gracilis TaxID=3053502 RepID=UPI0025773902|nr:hypothetical protein [Variovorax sp. J22R24]MDM0109833.1 hypothetical protein [Variovorax sp. J22R24]
MTTEEEVWLGRLKKPAGRFKPHCEFAPVARFNGTHWEPVRESERRARNGAVLCNDGLITVGQHVDTFWLYRRGDAAGGAMGQTAESPQRADSLLDLSGKTMAEARRILCERGVQLPDGNGNTAVVLLEDGLCAHLKFEKADQGWKVKVPAKGLIELFHAKPSWNQLDPDRRVPFLPESFDRDVVKTVSWLTDTEFLSQAFVQFSDAVSAYQSMLGGNEPAWRRLQRALKDARVSGAEVDEFHNAVERMRAEWPATSRALSGLRELSELFLETEEARAILVRAVEQRASEKMSEIESSIRSELDQRFIATREELAALEQRIELDRATQASIAISVHESRTANETLLRKAESLRNEVARTSEQTQSSRTQLARIKDEVEHLESARLSAQRERDEALAASKAIDERLRDFSQEARRAFEAMVGASDSHAAASLAERLRDWLAGAGKEVPPFMPSSVPPWSRPSAGEAKIIDTPALGERLSQEAENHGIQEQDLLMLDAFVRAGEPVLVAGRMADQSLRAYARAVSGGELRLQPLDPSIIGLDDLWRMPSTERPTAFALAWHRAVTCPDEPVLVCLRDLDAAPFRLWMTSLLSVLAAPDRPRNLLITATMSSPAGEAAAPSSLRADPARALATVVMRASQEAVTCPVVLGATLIGMPTRLAMDGSSLEPSPGAARAICKLEADPVAIARALRVAGAGRVSANGPSSESIGAWAKFWSDGNSNSAPPFLQHAVRALDNLRDTR